MSRNAVWYQRTFPSSSNTDISNWLTDLENDGDVTDIKFEGNSTCECVTVLARVEHNVSRVEITCHPSVISIEEIEAVAKRAVSRAIGGMRF